MHIRHWHYIIICSKIYVTKVNQFQFRILIANFPPFSRFHRQAIELTERTTPEQAAAIREPLNAVNRRWENLLRGMVDRQKQLEHALLHLGQFQHALNELLVWINKTDNTLDQLKPVCVSHVVCVQSQYFD